MYSFLNQPVNRSSRPSDVNIMSQLQMILNSPLTTRCHDLSIIVKETYFKERQNVFPILLDDIFGTSGNRSGIGWGIGLIQQSKNPREFQCVQEFLSPKGPLLSLCYKLMMDGHIQYEFDVQNLPIHTRQSINEGVIPGFYNQKLKNNLHHGVGLSLGTIVLNAFELYMFHFAHYLVNPENKQLGICWTIPEDFLYPRLLDDYLKFFLPFDGSDVPPIQEMCGLSSSYSSNQAPLSSTPLNSPQLLRKPQAMFGLSPLMIPSPKIDQPLLKNILPSPVVALNSKFTPNVSSNRQENWRHHGEVWCSETVVQIFVEFWLNQVPLSADRENLNISTLVRRHTTHADHVHMVRILIKHIHFFANSIGYDIQTSYSSFPQSNLDHLKKNVYPNLIQKKLYYFLRHSFDHWPLDASFRVVLELWLSSIQPWRYTKSNIKSTNAVDDASDLKRNRGVDNQWKKFIAENILFYSSVFRQLVTRFFRMDLTTFENSYMLYRVMHVFSQENLCGMIKQVESCLCDSPGGAKYDSDNASNPILGAAMRQSIAELEGPGYKYNSLMEDFSSITIPNLVTTLAQAVQVLKQSMREVEIKPTGFWKKIYVFLGGNGQSYEDEYVKTNSKKVEKNLTIAITGLCQMFNLPEMLVDCQTELPSIHEASSFQGLPNSSAPQKAPTTLNESCKKNENDDIFMTSESKRRIINGLARPKSINYRGNPDLQPIRSYECAFLVRQLYVISCLINTKFGDTMKEIYNTRQDFLGQVLKCFLEPPNIYLKKGKTGLNSVQETEFVPPRISLRYLASYQNIGYLLGLYLMLYVFGFGLFSFLILIISCPLLLATVKTIGLKVSSSR